MGRGFFVYLVIGYEWMKMQHVRHIAFSFHFCSVHVYCVGYTTWLVYQCGIGWWGFCCKMWDITGYFFM